MKHPERPFLHAIASPLGAALFLTDAVIESVQSTPDLDPSILQQLRQIHEALQTAQKLISERRSIIIAETEGTK